MESMIVVRAMKKADVKAVYEIEVLSFRTPWSYRSLMGELKNSVAHYTVMEKDGEVIGYCGMWVLFEEAHITNIAIHPKLRGHGYGKQLLHASMRAATSFGAEMMTLERPTRSRRVCTPKWIFCSRGGGNDIIRTRGRTRFFCGIGTCLTRSKKTLA